MRSITIAIFSMILCAGAATTAFAKAGDYFECPVPNGYQVALRDFGDLFSENDINDNSDHTGWYSPKIETAAVLYHAADPIKLPVAEFPYLVGRIVVDARFDSKLAVPIICGFYVSISGWVVTVEWEGRGMASFDIREALATVPLPGRGDTDALGSPALSLPTHVFRFSIDGQQFAYVLTAAAIAMDRVFRPDLVAAQPDGASIDTELFPSLDGVTGILVASPSLADRREWRGIEVEDAETSEQSPILRIAGTATQPVDVTETPIYLGQYMASPSPSSRDSDRSASLVLKETLLTVTLADGRAKSLELSSWIDARMSLGAPGIVKPALRFDIDGQAFNYVVSMMEPPAHIIVGDLFTSEPLLIKNARQRNSAPERP